MSSAVNPSPCVTKEGCKGWRKVLSNKNCTQAFKKVIERKVNRNREALEWKTARKS